ncbi:MFS transporter [Parvularcula marina]|uniref:AmpG family muropeptide MFS transporter n=1 Tax=Parvularcula marina TaxID=2292771 RepID=UPI003517074C
MTDTNKSANTEAPSQAATLPSGHKAEKDPRQLWGPSYLDTSSWKWVPGWLYPYMRPEMLAMLMLGFASGLPLYMFYSKTSIWLRDSGIERSTIGFFYWIGLAYTLKWIWAPVIDKTVIPLLGRSVGHRRSWMMVSIAGTVAGLLILATADPSQGLTRVLIGAGLVAFSGATLDVSIDAWRIESAPNKAQANMAASYSLGYRGALIFSGLGVSLAGWADSWTIAFCAMAAGMAACAILILLIKEPSQRKQNQNLDGLPFLAGPINATAVATAIFVAARIPKMFGIETIVVDILAVVAVAALIIGPLLFRGTKSPLPFRLLLAGVGAAFVYSHEIASLSGVPEDTPLFDVILAVVSILIIGIYARIVYQLVTSAFGTTADTTEEASRGKFYSLFATPLLQVWDRFGKVLIPILVLVLIYRTSDFTMGVMAGPLYIDLGYQKETIGLMQSSGVFAIIAGLFVGGLVANQIGVMRSLLVGAVLTIVTTAFYAYFATVGGEGETLLLATAINADNFAGGFVTTVFIGYLSSLVDPKYAATQYALFSSLYALLNKLVAGFSGLIVDALGYFWFFLLTASYSIPAIALIFVVMAMQKKYPPKPVGDALEEPSV